MGERAPHACSSLLHSPWWDKGPTFSPEPTRLHPRARRGRQGRPFARRAAVALTDAKSGALRCMIDFDAWIQRYGGHCISRH